MDAKTKQAGHAYMLASKCRQYLTWGVTVKTTPAVAIEHAIHQVKSRYEEDVEFEVTFLLPVDDVEFFRKEAMWCPYLKLEPCDASESPIGRYEGLRGNFLKILHQFTFEMAQIKREMGVQA